MRNVAIIIAGWLSVIIQCQTGCRGCRVVVVRFGNLFGKGEKSGKVVIGTRGQASLVMAAIESEQNVQEGDAEKETETTKEVSVQEQMDEGDVNEPAKVAEEETTTTNEAPEGDKDDNKMSTEGEGEAKDEDWKPSGGHDRQREQLLKPFERGWTREVVIRAVLDDEPKAENRKHSDVYYYTPLGEKLRSIPEVESYLAEKSEDRDLTAKNFSFKKSLIHKPPFETCRGAKRRRRTRVEMIRDGRVPPVVEQPRRGHRMIKAPKKLADEEEVKRPRKVIVKSVAAPVQVTVKKEKEEIVSKELAAGERCSLNCTGQEGIYPSVHCRLCLCLFHPQCVGLKSYDKAKQAIFVCTECNRKPELYATRKVRKSKLKAREVIHMCTEKKTRMRMPHKRELVKVEMTSRAPVLRVKMTSPREEAKSPPRTLEGQDSVQILKPLPPLRKAPALEKLNVADSEIKNYGSVTKMKPPALKASPGVHLLPKRAVGDGGPNPGPRMEYLIVASPSQNQAPIPTGICSNVTFPQVMQMGSLVPSLGPPVNGVIIRMPNPVTNNASGHQPPAIAPATIAPSSNSSVQFVVGRMPGVVQMLATTSSSTTVPQTAQTSSAPMMVLSDDVRHLLQNQSHLTITNVKSQAPPTLPSNVVISTHRQLTRRSFPPLRQYDGPKKKTLLPGGPHSVVAVLTKLASNGASSSRLSSQATMSVKSLSSQSNTDGESSDDTRLRVGRTTRFQAYRLRNRKNPLPVLCHITRLHGGFDGLLHIFKYLSVGDLLRASCVCRTWRTAASFPTLWKTVTLRDTRIDDWGAFAKVVQKYEINRLDFRGMKLSEDRNKTWHGFASVLGGLLRVKQIDFGEVPSSVVHTVANMLQDLEVLVAEEVTDGNKESEACNSKCRLDIGKFGQMTKLTRIRVRGLNGINLPTFCLSGGMMNLEALNNLTHLSLTSLKDVNSAEFGFLVTLANLVTLELGECNGWTRETFAMIGELENLQRLRLEMSADLNYNYDLGLDTAFAKLKKLVKMEFVLMPIPTWFCDTMESLTSLRELVFWTDTENKDAAVNNSNIMKAMEPAKSLRQLTWGIVLPKREFENQTNALDQFSKCVPFDTDTNFTPNDEKASPSECGPSVQMACPNALMGLLRTMLPTTEVRVVVSPIVTAFPACCNFR